MARRALWACIALGLALRFYGLGQKLFWYDEVISALRVSGFTEAEATSALAGSGPATRESFLQFQRPTNRGASDVVRGLATEEPQHPPLYFLALRIWMQLFGDSAAAARAFSAIASALVLLAFAWLCFELEFPQAAPIGCALLAVSPFQILYAQEAREIAHVMLLALVTSALLARALRLQQAKWFALYGFALLVFLYTSLFAAMVVAAHAIFVALASWFSRNTRRYLLASALAGAGLLPWARELQLHYSTSQLNVSTTRWMWEPMARATLVKRWLGHIARIFFDFSATGRAGETTPPWQVLLGLLPLFICALSVIELWRHRRERYAQLGLALLLGAAMVLFLPNFLGHGVHSTRTRYLCTFYLGLTLSTALLFAQRWRALLFAVLALGAISCALGARLPLGRNVDYGAELVETAKHIDRLPQDALAIDVRGANFATATALARALPEDRRILLPASASDLPPAGALVFGPDPQFLESMKRRFDVSVEQDAGYYKLQLWRATRR